MWGHGFRNGVACIAGADVALCQKLLQKALSMDKVARNGTDSRTAIYFIIVAMQINIQRELAKLP